MVARPGRLFGRLFWFHVLLVAATLGVSLAVIVLEFGRLREAELIEHLTAFARGIVPSVDDRFDAAHADQLDAIAHEVGSSGAEGRRVTLVLSDGTVVGESQAEFEELESHANRPEIIEALATGKGTSARWSTTVKRQLRYVAVRVGTAEAPLGVVRVAMPIQVIGAGLRPIRRLAWVIAIIGVLVAVVLALGLATLWGGRIARLTEAARSLAGGDLSARTTVSGHDEVALLARSLNRMRDRLASHLGTIDRQRRTLESLVAQLGEGVIVTDAQGRLVLVNPEARRLLQIETSDGFEGAPVEQFVGQPDLIELLHPRDASAAMPTRDDVRIELDTAAGPVHLLVRAGDITLPGPAGDEGSRGDRVGWLVVLTDVSALAKVAQVKTDFAANASHELRTPLSAIRAAVETLRTLDWAKDETSPTQFLEVIDRHRARMEAMVRDLLDLARVESPGAKFQPTALRPQEVLRELHAVFEPALTAKRLAWETQVDTACTAFVANPELLRIVLRNLLDNAIKFTEPGGHIRVRMRSETGRAVIAVEDDGCGIPAGEQQRVFERFYQVKRDRSGAERGTGLGLSIVRHAVAAMDGRVHLTSEPGRGTTVTLEIDQPGGRASRAAHDRPAAGTGGQPS